MTDPEGVGAGSDLDLDPDAVPVGSLHPVEVAGEPYVVAHHAEGWCLFADRCTHAPCAFTGNGEIVDGTVLVCNCHGAEFDLLTGDVLELPADEPLRIHPLRVEAGRLVRE